MVEICYSVHMEDYKIQRQNPNECAVTHRMLEPGETFYAAIFKQRGELIRRDYSQKAWLENPPKDAIAFWKTQLPQKAEMQRNRMAINDVLLSMFDFLLTDETQADKLYVLTLLLIRRRVFTLLDNTLEDASESGESFLEVECPKRNETYSVPVVTPTEERQGEIQDELTQILSGAHQPSMVVAQDASEEGEEEETEEPAELPDPDEIDLPEVNELDIDEETPNA